MQAVKVSMAAPRPRTSATGGWMCNQPPPPQMFQWPLRGLARLRLGETVRRWSNSFSFQWPLRGLARLRLGEGDGDEFEAPYGFNGRSAASHVCDPTWTAAANVKDDKFQWPLRGLARLRRAGDGGYFSGQDDQFQWPLRGLARLRREAARRGGEPPPGKSFNGRSAASHVCDQVASSASSTTAIRFQWPLRGLARLRRGANPHARPGPPQHVSMAAPRPRTSATRLRWRGSRRSTKFQWPLRGLARLRRPSRLRERTRRSTVSMAAPRPRTSATTAAAAGLALEHFVSMAAPRPRTSATGRWTSGRCPGGSSFQWPLRGLARLRR